MSKTRQQIDWSQFDSFWVAKDNYNLGVGRRKLQATSCTLQAFMENGTCDFTLLSLSM